MAELVDIVDATDKPTGQKLTIAEAHKAELPHRIAAVLVFRENGSMLVQVHKHHGRKLDHTVGGHVSAGETYEAAAHREMIEELGIDVPLKQVAEGVMSDEQYTDTQTHIVHRIGVFTAVVGDNWSHTETEEVDQLIEMPEDMVYKKMLLNPDGFLQGFLSSYGALLASQGSDRKINAYGKNWGEL